MDYNQHEEEIIQETSQINNNEKEGKFFKKKILSVAFLVIAALVIIILFRNEFFSSSTTSDSKKNVKKEETQNSTPPLDANYGDAPSDLQNSYDDGRIGEYTEEDFDAEAVAEEIDQAEQERLNRLQELENEAMTALRSPTTIAIATRPQIQSVDNKLLLAPNKPVTDYDGNRQESKKNFLMNEAAQKFYQTNFLQEQLSEFELKAGDFIPAIMVTGINSDLPSKVITALVSENVRDTITGRHVLIPQGTRIVGTYDSSITFGQERLLVIWQRLLLPNGKSLALDNMQGVDLTGKAGITGDVDNHFSTLLKGVILSSFLGSVGTISSADKFGNDNWRTSAAQGAGEQIVSIGDRFAERALSRQPTITIPAGERFNIMVHSDLILEPYEG